MNSNIDFLKRQLFIIFFYKMCYTVIVSQLYLKGESLNREVLENRTRMLKALSHPSRLLIIDALKDGEKCVCELQVLVGTDLSTVSRHLTLMKNAGLLSDRKVGLNVYYKLKMLCINDFLASLDNTN